MQKAMIMHNSSQNNPSSNSSSQIDIDAGLAAILAQCQDHEQGLIAPIPLHWRQGRTCYGGLSLALAYQAALGCLQSAPEKYASGHNTNSDIGEDISDLTPLRSVQINFTGPINGDPIFTPRLLRQGRNVSAIAVTGVIDAALSEHNTNRPQSPVIWANFIFGKSRKSLLNLDYPAPQAPSPELCPDYAPQPASALNPDQATPYNSPAIDMALLPQFLQNFELRFIAGGRPIQGAKEGYIRVWARHRDQKSRQGLASLLAISDVLPPAAMPMLTQMAPVSSVNFTLNLLTAKVITHQGWWHIESQQSAAQDGYSSQIMRIWNSEGVLVAEGMQCVAIFI